MSKKKVRVFDRETKLDTVQADRLRAGGDAGAFLFLADATPKPRR